MKLVSEYIKLPKSDRQSHLDLDSSCIERGGYSTHFKGILAVFLDTDIPAGRILLCHACNNEKCSNPTHLYWGTDLENTEDAIKYGARKTIWEWSVLKYGIEKARSMQITRSSNMNEKLAQTGRPHLKKPKTEEHKRKIAESLRNRKLRV